MYLKDLIGMVPGGVLTARITSIGPVETNRNGKELRKVQFLFPSTGKTHEEGVFNFNFNPPRGSLVNLQTGDTVEMKLDEKGWPVFRIITGTSETAPVQSQTNTAQVKSERAATSAINASDEKSIAISLQGLVQAYVSGVSLVDKHNSRDTLIEEALTFAEKAREAINRKAKSIHMGVSLPIPKTALSEVEGVFGADSPF